MGEMKKNGKVTENLAKLEKLKEKNTKRRVGPKG